MDEEEPSNIARKEEKSDQSKVQHSIGNVMVATDSKEGQAILGMAPAVHNEDDQGGSDSDSKKPGAVRIGNQEDGDDTVWSRNFDEEKSQLVAASSSTIIVAAQVAPQGGLVASSSDDVEALVQQRLREQHEKITVAEPVAEAFVMRPFFSSGRRKALIVCIVFVTIAVVVGVLLATSQRKREPSPQPTLQPSPQPTLQPSSKPVLPVISKSITVPIGNTGGSTFDQYAFLGLTSADETNINKIMQIAVYFTTVCITDNNCSLPTASVLSLRTSYLLKDGSTSVITQGAYTGEDKSPVGTVNVRSNEFVNQIELGIADQRISYIMVCTSADECFGPFGNFSDTTNSTVFQEPNSVIKAFYGYSGSWIDALGVYYEESNLSRL